VASDADRQMVAAGGAPSSPHAAAHGCCASSTPLGVGASRTTRIGPPAAMRPRAAVPCLAWTGDPTPAQPTPRERYVDCRSGLSEEDGNVDVHEVLLVQIEEYGLLPSWIHGLWVSSTAVRTDGTGSSHEHPHIATLVHQPSGS